MPFLLLMMPAMSWASPIGHDSELHAVCFWYSEQLPKLNRNSVRCAEIIPEYEIRFLEALINYELRGRCGLRSTPVGIVFFYCQLSEGVTIKVDQTTIFFILYGCKTSCTTLIGRWAERFRVQDAGEIICTLVTGSDRSLDKTTQWGTSWLVFLVY